jgi:hypothetical protein
MNRVDEQGGWTGRMKRAGWRGRMKRAGWRGRMNMEDEEGRMNRGDDEEGRMKKEDEHREDGHGGGTLAVFSTRIIGASVLGRGENQKSARLPFMAEQAAHSRSIVDGSATNREVEEGRCTGRMKRENWRENKERELEREWTGWKNRGHGEGRMNGEDEEGRMKREDEQGGWTRWRNIGRFFSTRIIGTSVLARRGLEVSYEQGGWRGRMCREKEKRELQRK